MAWLWLCDGAGWHVSEWAGPYVSIPMVRLGNATPLNTADSTYHGNPYQSIVKTTDNNQGNVARTCNDSVCRSSVRLCNICTYSDYSNNTVQGPS